MQNDVISLFFHYVFWIWILTTASEFIFSINFFKNYNASLNLFFPQKNQLPSILFWLVLISDIEYHLV